MTMTSPGPTEVSRRALGPDLARGVMLLAIALANSHYFLQGSQVRGGYPQDVSPIDSVVTWLLATVVDGRAFPMFGLLFGYGVARLTARHEESGRPFVRRMLWRRSLVLVTVGVIDGMLFYVGDILAMYGVLLFVGVVALWWRDRYLLGVAGLLLFVGFLPSTSSSSISAAPPDASSMLPADLVTMLTGRAIGVVAIALLGPLGFLGPFLVGLWAGRRRILERPDEHRLLLRLVAAVGITAAVLGAQPVALMLSGVTDVPSAEVLRLIGPLHDATGVLGGFGYAALIALLAQHLERRRGRVVDALAATGQRSMTCYLLQSPVWAITFTPFLLDLSTTLTVTSTAALACAVWVGSVVLADVMRRRGYRGPFELLVRRVTYGASRS